MVSWCRVQQARRSRSASRDPPRAVDLAQFVGAAPVVAAAARRGGPQPHDACGRARVRDDLRLDLELDGAQAVALHGGDPAFAPAAGARARSGRRRARSCRPRSTASAAARRARPAAPRCARAPASVPGVGVSVGASVGVGLGLGVGRRRRRRARCRRRDRRRRVVARDQRARDAGEPEQESRRRAPAAARASAPTGSPRAPAPPAAAATGTGRGRSRVAPAGTTRPRSGDARDRLIARRAERGVRELAARSRSGCAGSRARARAMTASSSGGSAGSLGLAPQVADPRRPTGQHEQQRAAQRVHVGARIDVLALQLLGRGVLERPADRARSGRPRPVVSCLASPKSVSSARSAPGSPTTRMLLGLTSRCTTPIAWAASSAVAI